MIFVLLMLWTVTLVLLAADAKRPSIRWLSFVAFAGGAGALSAVLGDTVLPGIAPDSPLYGTLFIMEKAASLVQYYGLPYTYVLFAIHYNPDTRLFTHRRLLTVLLLVPPALTLGLIRPMYPVPFAQAALWVLPYMVTGSWIIMAKREPVPALRRMHQVTAWAIVPTVVLCTLFSFVFPLLGVYEMWRYNIWVIAAAFLAFVVSIFRFGFLGIQFLFEKRRLDHAFRAITSGTAILNHAIKNDLGKMSLFTDKLLAEAREGGLTEMEKDLRIVQSSARHIGEMIQRVHQQTQDVVLRLAPVDLAALLEELLDSMGPLLAGYRVKAAYRVRPVIEGDGAHIAETVTNIVTNAVEAMPEGGELNIRLFETKRSYYVRLKDTGPGIPKEQLRRVLEPFFTTKSKLNFGLGLAYAYKVMQVHGGNLEIESVVGEGTTVYISFPKAKPGTGRRFWRMGRSWGS
ncbi:sensor histidine kinase [Paenibacillus chartarius]|uniref:histidine kinase n=1 Tax=Paenibacillus chartarius TaxID=747481 RepID=A0ABV6DFF2_9BACL